MAPFSKPETVLKQAEGLVSVGQQSAALQSLTDVFNSKRLRSTPLAALEPIMLRFVDLCVEMRKGRTAKEGLMQYKNIAQNTSVGSIEVVIKRFVQLADQKVLDAQEKAEKVIVSLEDVDDLEATETPESILLGAVSGDQSRDRTDRALVTPWLKFLWEAYRTALETLKNNARLELIYQQIAQQAFKFCLKHTRKVEFRRLCETLRLHLSNVAKYAHQPHSVNLSDPDTLQRHLDTRFAQLSAAVELELWQEAFRSVEDVHNLLTMAKKSPRPSMMAGYYEKLTRIFLMSGNSLYHAASWSRYYSIVRTNPAANIAKLPDDDNMAKLAGIVLLSALSVPLHCDESEQPHSGKVSRLTSLLGLAKQPTRSSLLTSALASCTLPANTPLLKVVPEPIKALYRLLETSFAPLNLCNDTAGVLKELETLYDGLYKAYVPHLREVIMSRLLGQLAQVYETIKIEKLLALVKPLEHGNGDVTFGMEKIEAFVIAAARRGEICVHIDHAEGIVSFEDKVFHFSKRASSSKDLLQPSASEVVRTRISDIASCLSTSIPTLFPRPSIQDIDFAALAKTAEAERKSLALRRAIIARRRELLSELSARKEKEAAGRRAEASRREKEEEAKRALEDVRKKELERQRKERENIKIEEAKKLAKSLHDRGSLKVNIETVEQLDSESLMRLQVEQLEKEKKEGNERMRIIAKRLDHTERALRKAERPLLALDYDQQQTNDRAAHAELAKRRVALAREEHASALQTKDRLSRMMGDYVARRADIAGKRGEEYARKKEEAGRKVEEEKAKRRKAVAKTREEERKRKEEEERIRLAEEAEAARLEEEQLAEQRRLEEEEAAKIAAEEEERRKKEEDIQKMKLQREAERKEREESARKQRLREEEAEIKAQRRREEQKTSRVAPTLTPTSGRTTNGDSAWRRPSAGVAVSSTAADSNSSPSTGAYRPPLAARGGAPTGGGWRAKEAAKLGGLAPSTPPPRPPPAGVQSDEPTKGGEEDGFQTVSAKKDVWRPRRGRG